MRKGKQKEEVEKNIRTATTTYQRITNIQLKMCAEMIVQDVKIPITVAHCMAKWRSNVNALTQTSLFLCVICLLLSFLRVANTFSPNSWNSQCTFGKLMIFGIEMEESVNEREGDGCKRKRTFCEQLWNCNWYEWCRRPICLAGS